MQIKLVPGNSAGIVVAFYDGVDFEFLGIVPGQPYILQTNVHVNGFDDREQRIRLWFDPTKDFHAYSVLWNLYQILFMVDWAPMRTYRNDEDKGSTDWVYPIILISIGPYHIVPNTRWVYERRPSVPYPKRQPLSLQMSIWNGEDWTRDGGRDRIDCTKAPFGRLFRWVRKYFLMYDYCQDNRRFGNNLPKEFFLTKY
ncbi:Xyloglucan:xyloglucosyl transferase [Handroanthus impetiginosus]|uniref:xyloglucan:xyloglucosyl transferase n=1 Tax=Handroanthus impetiginosus TaxID=429701 RepID=A0A2G9GH15_9LAMI|nr:Xyloglucan:xyloglucosyl transferase [Handroanthus impetiginosus]